MIIPLDLSSGRVLVEPIKVDTTLILPDDEKKVEKATVVSVSPNIEEDELKSGDVVIFSDYSAIRVKNDEDNEMLFIKADEILAKIT